MGLIYLLEEGPFVFRRRERRVLPRDEDLKK